MGRAADGGDNRLEQRRILELVVREALARADAIGEDQIGALLASVLDLLQTERVAT